MKQITFNYFRRLALMLLAVVGFTTTALAQEDEWTTIFENSLGGERNTVPSDPIYTGGFRRSNVQNLSLLDPSSSYFPSATFTTDPNVYLAVKKNLEPGTYKFSFRVKGAINKNINVFYTTDISDTSSRNILLENLNTSLKEANWGPKETGEFEIPVAGDYYIGICGATDDDFKYLFLADFIIYKKGGAEPVPTTFTVNFSNIENGTVEVTAKGEKIDSGDAVEDGTEITITPTANPGYKVKTVYANGTKLTPKPESVDGQIIMRYKTTVTEDTEITAEILPVEYSISVSTATNGSIVVYNVTDLKNPLENNAKLTAGNQVKVVATPNPDYKLARVYYKYTGYNYEGEAIEITDNGKGYIFTVGPDPESANTAIYIYAEFVEDTPAETWSEVHFNTMSGKEIDLNSDPYYMNPAKSWSKINSGATVTGDKTYGPYIKTPQAGYYLAYKYKVEKEATYRFSFVHKKGETKDITVKLCYTKDLESTFTDASAATEIPKKRGDDSGDLFQSNNVVLEPGDYYFVYYIETAATGDIKVRIADFKLEMLDGSEVETTPEYNITVKKPVNGTLYISYTLNDEPQTIDTSTFANDSEVFSIPENTILNISPMAEYDYELDQILPAGMEEKTDPRGRIYYELTVTEDVTIEAAFKAIQYGKVSVTSPDDAQGSIEIQLHDPMFDTWDTADDFYLAAVEFDTELRANVTAKTGYTVKSVMKNGTAIDKNTDGYYYFTVDAEEITISAEFEQEAQDGYLITITNPAEGGTIKVMNGETEVTNNSRVPENTTVTIIPEAAPGYTTQKVLANGKIVAPRLVDEKPVYEKSITEDTEFTVVFKVMEYEINWVDPKNGTLKLYNSNNPGQELVKGTKVPAGTKITVVPDANDNYIFTRTYYTLGGKEVEITEGEKGFEFTVTPDSENPNNTVFYVYAEFEPETYTLTTEVTPEEGGTVSVTVDGKPAGETVKYGDVITVTVTENPRYKHESTVVEGAEEIDGQAGEYTVKGAVTITVTFTEDTSSINSIENGTVYYNAAEEILYTGNAASVRVYDLSGRLVLNADSQETVSLAELADGVYTAIVGNVVLKLKK